MQKLPTDQIQAAGQIMFAQHKNETGNVLDLLGASGTIGKWEDGRHFLRVDFPCGTWWELAFGDEADAVLSKVIQ